MKFRVSQTLTFSKEIEADSKEDAERLWSERGADTQYSKLHIREVIKPQRNKEHVIHASGQVSSSETDCGLYISEKILALDTNLSGNINRITCKRCLQIAFKN